MSIACEIDRKKFLNDLLLVERIVAHSLHNQDRFWIDISGDKVYIVSFGGIGYVKIDATQYFNFTDDHQDFTICVKLDHIMHFVKNMKLDQLVGSYKIDKRMFAFSNAGSSKGKWDIATIDMGIPPLPDKFKNTHVDYVPINLAEMSEGINKIKFSVDRDQSRAPLTGVKLDVVSKGIILYATDGTRVSRYRIREDYDIKHNLHIPHFTFDVIDRIFHNYGPDCLFASHEDFFVVTSEDGRYIYYAPQEAPNAKFPQLSKFFKQDLIAVGKLDLNALKQNLALIQEGPDDDNLKMKLELHPSALLVSGKSSALHFNFEVAVEDGVMDEEEGIPIIISAKYLRAVVSSGLNSPEVTIGIAESPTANKIPMLYFQDGAFDHLMAPTGGQ